MLLPTRLEHDTGIVAQVETCENSRQRGNNGVNKNGLDSLPCVPTAWTITLGKKKDSSLLISLFLSRRLTVPPPLSLPPFGFLSFSLTLYHFTLRTVFLCSKEGGGGGAAVCPRRIKSGLQSCDECSHECGHLTSLAPFSLPLTAPNLAIVAGRVSEILYYKPSSGLHYSILKHFNSFLFLSFFLYLFGNSFNSRMLLAAQRGIISYVPVFS